MARSRSCLWLVLACACSAPAPTTIMLPDVGPRTDASIDDAFVAPSDAGPPAVLDTATEGSLHTPRLSHTATLLPNGHVLVIGGENLARVTFASIEEYDPATGMLSEVASMPEPRSNHTATLLADGRVLIVGGGESDTMGLPSRTNVSSSALFYDPTTHAMTPTGALMHARSHHAAIRLVDGTVLVVGGSSPSTDTSDVVADAERFDASTGTWSSAGTLGTPRTMTRVELDASGAPLVIGGLAGSAGVDAIERWASGAFTDAGHLAGPGRFYHATATTSEGDVLVVGGLGFDFVDAVDELTHGQTAFHAAPPLPSARNSVALARTTLGVVAISGFFYSSSSGGRLIPDVLLRNASTGAFESIGELDLGGRAGHTATTLSDGSIVVIGGYDDFGEAPQAIRLTLSAAR